MIGVNLMLHKWMLSEMRVQQLPDMLLSERLKRFDFLRLVLKHSLLARTLHQVNDINYKPPTTK